MSYFNQEKIYFGTPYKEWDLIETTVSDLKIKFNESICGYCDSEKREIYVALDDINKPESIFLHELIHAFDMLSESYRGENLIDFKADLLLKFIVLNPDLMGVLLSKNLK